VSRSRRRPTGRGAEASRPAADTRPAQPILPPFTEETARLKVKLAGEAWNTRDPDVVVPAYTEDSEWRNRTEFLRGRAEIRAFLERKWPRELRYRLRKELWAFTGVKN
jgi:nuclear transport factor 2 (NTF2) superfamily protein